MTTDHEKMLEDRYILDFQRSAQVRARRNALLANWLAIRTRRNNAVAMTTKVIRHAQNSSDDDALCDDIRADLEGDDKIPGRAEMREKMHSLLLEAARQLFEDDATRE